MTHEEIIYICCDLTILKSCFLQNFVKKNMCTSKNLSNDSKKQKISWLTPTGIQFSNGPWVSGMEINTEKYKKIQRTEAKVKPIYLQMYEL